MQWRVKKEGYRLTWKAKGILAAIFAIVFWLFLLNAYSFLSPQKHVEARILVIEGWINDYALEESLAIFRKEKYDHMIITGGPLNAGYLIMNYMSTAEIAYKTLLHLGANPDSMSIVSRELVWRERTYQTGLELKKYLKANFPHIKSFNMISLGAHSRRSWLLFRKAMPEYEIGIITIEEKLFDTSAWWKSSKGFRTVFTEGIGFLYSKFFFFP